MSSVIVIGIIGVAFIIFMIYSEMKELKSKIRDLKQETGLLQDKRTECETKYIHTMKLLEQKKRVQ